MKALAFSLCGQGHVCLRGLFSRAEVATFAPAVEAAVEAGRLDAWRHRVRVYINGEKEKGGPYAAKAPQAASSSAATAAGKAAAGMVDVASIATVEEARRLLKGTPGGEQLGFLQASGRERGAWRGNGPPPEGIRAPQEGPPHHLDGGRQVRVRVRGHTPRAGEGGGGTAELANKESSPLMGLLELPVSVQQKSRPCLLMRPYIILPCTIMEPLGSSRHLQVVNPHLSSDVVGRLARSGRLAAVAAALLGAPRVRLLQSAVFVKVRPLRIRK